MGSDSDESKTGNFLYKNNKFYHLVDSLPFVDTVPTDLDGKVKELVNQEMQLILEESGLSEPDLLAKYLDPLPLNFKEDDTLFKKELNRIKNGLEMEKLDLDKYSSLPDTKDPKGRLNHLKLLMEFSQDSLINLELMDRYKEGSWLKYLDSLTLLKIRMEKHKKALDSRLDELNKRRKLAHIEAASRLKAINQDYEEYKHKNRQLLVAIESLQQSRVIHDDL